MLAATLMIPIHDATGTLERVRRTDGPVQLAEEFAHLNVVCKRLREARSLVASGEIRAEIDPDFLVDDALEQLKVAARALRREIGAIAPVAAITAEIYSAANQLQWELSEHDVDYAPRKSGYVAHNREESDAVLDRILREK